MAHHTSSGALDDLISSMKSAVAPFLARTTKGLEGVPRSRVRNYTFAEALAAGEASAEMIDAILRDPDLPADRRRELLDDATWYVPRFVKP